MRPKRGTLTAILPRGRPKTHGGYSFLTTGKLPEHRRAVLAYLSAARSGLVHDLGPKEEDLTAAQGILIDRTVTALGIVRCIEEFIRDTSVMAGRDVAPALQQTYLAYVNHVRLNLAALGIGVKVSIGRDRHLKIMTIEKAAPGEPGADDPDTLVIEKVMVMPRPGQNEGQDMSGEAIGRPRAGDPPGGKPVGEGQTAQPEVQVKQLQREIAELEARKKQLMARRGKDHEL